MQILGNLFNIIIFVGVIGSVFAVLLLFLQKALRFSLPLWAGLLGAAFYLVPIVVPNIYLIPPEENLWIPGYQVASMIWITGAGVFMIGYLLRGLLAYHAVKRYAVCEDERIHGIYTKCASGLNLTAIPPLLFGSLKDPACVVTISRPAVILNREIALLLSDQELQVVFCHELTHIKRKHHLAQRIYDLISALYWFNPLVWIAKYEFNYTCEIDCDTYALKVLGTDVAVKEYGAVLLHLLKLSSENGGGSLGKIGALGFFRVKQRFVNILRKPSKKRSIATSLVVALCVVLTIIFSAAASRAMFYPYPAYSYGSHEYAEQTDQ